MRVPTLSIVFMVISMLAAVGMFLGLMLVLKLKYKMRLSAFFTGCATMVLFAFVLESLMHQAVLTGPAGEVLQSNFRLYALYAAAAAAIFEETGRIVAMKFVLKKQHGIKNTGIMYGAGHGGIEALYLLGVGMISNLVAAVMINAGNIDLLYAGMDEATAAAYTEQLNVLCTTASPLFLVGALERVFAITAHLGFSIFVWKGVTKKQPKYIGIAYVMHFILDFASVMVNEHFGVAATEAAAFVIALITVLWARKVYMEDDAATAQAGADVEAVVETLTGAGSEEAAETVVYDDMEDIVTDCKRGNL